MLLSWAIRAAALLASLVLRVQIDRYSKARRLQSLIERRVGDLRGRDGGPRSFRWKSATREMGRPIASCLYSTVVASAVELLVVVAAVSQYYQGSIRRRQF